MAPDRRALILYGVLLFFVTWFANEIFYTCREVCDLREKVGELETELVKLREHVQHREEEQQEEMEYLQTKLGRKDRDLQVNIKS